jgi:hypothetical protein
LPTKRVEGSDQGGADEADQEDNADKGGRDGRGGGGRYHPFIEGLLSELPDKDKFAGWPIEEQAEWLIAAASIFKLLSKSKGRISINADGVKETADRQ